MNREDNLIKQLETYLDLELNEFDRKRILGYVNEYVESLPDKPKIQINGKSLVRELKVHKFSSSIRRYPNKTDPNDIINLVSYATGITNKQLISRDRYANIIIARHVSMYLIRTICNWSLKNIGAIFNRDHTTVINAINHVATLLETYPEDCLHIIDYVNKNLKAPKEKTA